MRNLFRSSALVAGAFVISAFGLAQSARAGTIELLSDLRDGVNGGYSMNSVNLPNEGTVGAGEGGEFGVRITNFTGLTPPPMGAGVADNRANNGMGWPGDSLFQTFCLELSEGVATHNQGTSNVEVSGPHFVYDWTLDTAAVGGGKGSVNGNDPISAQTAFLYTNFWQGTLATYNYAFGTGRRQSATDLQAAIWYFEDELSVSDGAGGWIKPNIGVGSQFSAGALFFINLANTAVATTWGNTVGSVRVLNLTTYNAQGQVVNAQSVLVLVPLPPAAWLGLGLMTAMGAVGLLRRRKQQQSLV